MMRSVKYDHIYFVGDDVKAEKIASVMEGFEHVEPLSVIVETNAEEIDVIMNPSGGELTERLLLFGAYGMRVTIERFDEVDGNMVMLLIGVWCEPHNQHLISVAREEVEARWGKPKILPEGSIVPADEEPPPPAKKGKRKLRRKRRKR